MTQRTAEGIEYRENNGHEAHSMNVLPYDVRDRYSARERDLRRERLRFWSMIGLDIAAGLAFAGLIIWAIRQI